MNAPRDTGRGGVDPAANRPWRLRPPGPRRSPSASTGVPLPPTHGSLARGVAPARPGTLFVLALTGGMTLGPGEGREVIFGRNRPDVHVCLGEDDAQISRRQGTLTHRGGQWWLRNTGRVPIRCAQGRLLYRGEEPLPLDTGYTPLFVSGSGGRQHLLEVYVCGPEGQRPMPRHEDVTRPPRVWVLSEEERLVLVVLGQRYLLHHPRPQPLTRKQTAAQLAELRPHEEWGEKRVEHIVNRVRLMLSRDGVPWLTREEVGEPVGNALNDNLIRALMESLTLVPKDLALLEGTGEVRDDEDA